ncbi:hypothetical protein [Luteitalea sp.]|jgi:hypothetical protein|uniref:hypothetical protein n=1 Tax=Luteitalea sp. TaxID=2004800 RepID=UPI0037C67151
MATDHHHPHSSHGDDGAGPLNHETTDISLDGVGKLTVGFVVILCVVSLVVFGAYRMLDRRATAADTSISKINEGRGVGTDVRSRPLMDPANTLDQVGTTPAGPKLLTNEPVWLRDIKAKQQATVTSYGWVDKGAGVVRLPLDRAKALIAERGLPVTTPPAEAAPADAAVPADGAAAAAPVATPQP